MSWTWRRTAALAAAAIALAAASFVLAPRRRANVLWISIDSLRADRLPAYGFAALRTPYIDYLAAQGVVFENAFSDAPWTTASMASSLTGRFALHHGLRTPFAPLGAAETTAAEILAERGWQTAAIVGTFSLDRVFRLDQGFDHYDDRYDSPIRAAGNRPHMPRALHANLDEQRTYRTKKRSHDSYRSDAAVADAARGWLQESSRWLPFFLWVHFFGPHPRTQMGEDAAAAVARVLDPYDEYIEGVDRQIGRLLEELTQSGRLGDTIIVLQADHGEDRLQHHELGHGQQLYDSVLHVPLIIAWPGRLPPARVRGMVRTVDILPTVLDLLGLPTPGGLDGMSLLPRLRGGPGGESPPLLAETLLSAEAEFGQFLPDGSLASPGLRRLAVRTPRWKYVVATRHPLINYTRQPRVAAGGDAPPREELYDLLADPGETTDVAASHPDVVQSLRHLLAAQGSKS